MTFTHFCFPIILYAVLLEEEYWKLPSE